MLHLRHYFFFHSRVTKARQVKLKAVFVHFFLGLAHKHGSNNRDNAYTI